MQSLLGAQISPISHANEQNGMLKRKITKNTGGVDETKSHSFSLA